MYCPECGTETKMVFVMRIEPSVTDILRRKPALRIFACDECLIGKLTVHLERSKRFVKVGALR